jgi:CubicO group peptidase (beta-lactamase class C family)
MSEFLNRFAALARETDCNIYRVTEIVNGKSETLELMPTNRCHNVYSVAKAFTATAIGLLQDRGLLQLDDRITDILHRYLPKGLDPRWEAVTIEDAMKHRLGLPQGFLDIDAKDCPAYGADFLSTLFLEPFVAEPASVYCYTDAAYYLLSRVAEEASGMPLDALLQEALFAPLQFAETAFTRCPQGHPMGATGLYIHTADAAKLGALYLQGGVWEGKRYFSEEWAQTVLKKQIEFHRIADTDAFGKGGMYGQMLLFSPHAHRVVCWQGFSPKGCGELMLFATKF